MYSGSVGNGEKKGKGRKKFLASIVSGMRSQATLLGGMVSNATLLGGMAVTFEVTRCPLLPTNMLLLATNMGIVFRDKNGNVIRVHKPQ